MLGTNHNSKTNGKKLSGAVKCYLEYEMSEVNRSAFICL